MGAKVELIGSNGCAPVRIHGGHLKSLKYTTPVASAQVKSCVLFAGLFADGRTSVTEPKATRDHTEKVLEGVGVPVKIDGLRISIDGYGSAGPNFKGRNWDIPGDFSSAAFWLVAAAVSKGSQIAVENVGLNPRRIALLDVLRRMGAEVEVRGQMTDDRGQMTDDRGQMTDDRGQMTDDRGQRTEIGNRKSEISWEAMGTIMVRGGELKGTVIGGDEIPNLIDELPIAAVAGALAEGRTIIRDAAELRVKESDRIATMAKALTSLGVKVEEKPDGMIIHGRARIKGGAVIDSHGDHRIAMATAMLAFSADSPVRIDNIACINTSYPSFLDHFKQLAGSK